VILSQYLASSRAVNEHCDWLGVINSVPLPAGPWQVVTLTAGTKRQSLLMAGDDYKMFMTRSLNVTPKTTGQHMQ